jgi:hypothetical protein
VAMSGCPLSSSTDRLNSTTHFIVASNQVFTFFGERPKKFLVLVSPQTFVN